MSSAASVPRCELAGCAGLNPDGTCPNGYGVTCESLELEPPKGHEERRGASAASPSRPRLLDLFCGAGGAAAGYHRAGFEVVGVDIMPQPNYPFEFIQEDALWFLRCGHYRGWSLSDFDAIHASPPCQLHTRARALRTVKIDHPDLIGPTRKLLEETGLPYIIENVPGAPLISPVQLCGTAFGLGGPDWDLQRHRLFEASFPILRLGACRHRLPAISVVGHGATKATRERLGRNPVIAEKRAAMGIDWMNRDELSEAIPPAYTEWVGYQLLSHIREEVAA